MFNPALLQAEVLDIHYTLRGNVHAPITSLSKRSPRLSCSPSKCKAQNLDLAGALAEFNSYSDSFVGPVRLPASRRPCFG